MSEQLAGSAAQAVESPLHGGSLASRDLNSPSWGRIDVQGRPSIPLGGLVERGSEASLPVGIPETPWRDRPSGPNSRITSSDACYSVE